MSSLEQTVESRPALPSVSSARGSYLSRFLDLLCSVRLGVTLLILLGLLCFLGMIIMQQSVDGFDRYFADLTPAQRLVYGRLGLFDIYHAWYFNALLAVLSLNIILASIDRFPKTWIFVSKPNLTVPVRWLEDQKQSARLEMEGGLTDVVPRITETMERAGWKNAKVTEKNGRTFIFAQSGVWNRFGTYAVHVGLLTIFLGGFLTAQLGSTGSMPLMPGQKTNLMYETVVELDRANQITKQLPFEVTCTDIQQKLIKKEGPIAAMNTIDWMTVFKITDETGTHDAMVQMNRPFDYRGYRFFQASFTNVGRARNITVNATPAAGGIPETVTLPRDGSTTLSDGTRIKFAEFRGNFSIGPEDPDEDTSTYPNPGAVLQVTQAGTPPLTAYAFGPQMANIPVAKKPVAGYTFQLVDFEKVGEQHILSVQRDPGSTVVYIGFALLCLMLVAVFFFSHQRVWAAIEPRSEKDVTVILGGNTNRNVNAFEEKFKRFANELTVSRST